MWKLSIFLSITICISNAVQSIITPTSINGHIENYINSESNTADYFYEDTINCGTTTCNIECDAYQGCYGTTINAESSTTTINIKCSEYESCYNMKIYADIVENIDIKCNWNGLSSSYQNASCYNATLYGRNSGNTNLYCTHNNCYSIHLYLDDAMSATIYAEGYRAMYVGNIYADRIKDGLDITCNGSYACHDVNFYTTAMTSNVSLLCYARHACYTSTLYGGTMTGDVSIKCESDPNNTVNYEGACTSFKANTDQIAGSLIVDCINDDSCIWIYVHCPDTSCNVKCLGDNSCYAAQIYIEDQFNVNYLNLECGDCNQVYINCADRGGHSMLNTAGTCVTHGCCPYDIHNNTCIAGQSCVMNCNDASCAGNNIDASKATGLILNCLGYRACEGSKIICPTVSNGECIITCDYESCPYAYIIVGDNNVMNEFDLQCTGSSGCEGVLVEINAKEIKEVNVDCNGQYTSSSYSGCSELKIRTKENITNIGNITIKCSQYGCQKSEFELGTANKVVMDCNGYRSCSVYYAGNTFKGNTDDLSINCKGTQSCYAMNIDYIIGNDNFVLDCLSEESCVDMNMNIHSTKMNANISINCMNAAGSSNWQQSACNGANFYIYGYVDNDVSTNNISIQCNKLDCQSTKFYVYDAYYVDAGCNEQYSCDSMYLEVNTSKYLHLDCNDASSCSYADIYCPYQDIDVCDIHCSSKGSSCHSGNIYVQDSYIYGYLDLQCDGYGSCGWLYIECSGGKRSGIFWEYNNANNDYECSDSGSSYCCPYYDGPTSEPTSQPTMNTAQPTSQPTTQPTSSPTDQPTTATHSPSTSQPSSHPTTNPTVDPTDFPTSTLRNMTSNQSKRNWLIIICILCMVAICVPVAVVLVKVIKKQKNKTMQHVELIECEETT